MTNDDSAAVNSMSSGHRRDMPVAPGDRILFLDVLRGFAVMAIFFVNIKAMLAPFAFYMNANLWDTSLDQMIAMGQRLIVEDKWRTIFTALYGAGLALIAAKADAAGGQAKQRLIARTLWLAAFGAFHLLLIWTGDILFVYGVVGLLALLLRNLQTKTLFWVAAGCLLLGWIWMSVFSVGSLYVPEVRTKMEAIMWGSDAKMMAEELAGLGGTWTEQLANRLESAVGYVVFGLLFGGMTPVSLGLMLMGMFLYRIGLLQGAWRPSVTLPMALICLGGAWALDIFQLKVIMAANWDFAAFSKMMPLGILDGWIGALGYVALISFVVSMGARLSPVSAVGRMAFTNYIICSLIGTTLAGGHGFGFGLFGEVGLATMMGVVGATMVGMLIWSPLWLSVFRFGPLEWLWRSLTYGRLQPIVRR
ncbi:MAG: DUF418 domain-containing protein [Pseudomonadota bacterium]